MTKRSIFLPNESYIDVQSALGKATNEIEYRKIISDRLKANGWSKELELKFREDCRNVGFVFGSPPKFVEGDTGQRPASRFHTHTSSQQLRQGKIQDEVEK